MQRIVFTRSDGGVTVVIPAPGVSIADAQATVPDDAVDIQIVDIAAIPTDRSFRDAWQQTGGVVSIPLVAAKRVARRKISALVREEFALLDIVRTEAEVEGDTVLVGQIDTRKTTIRSTAIPAIRDGIINAASVADLKTVQQSYLDSRPQRVKDELS